MTTCSTLLYRATTILQDAGFVRWTSPELVTWLNDGIRDTINLDPTANEKIATVILVAGAKQTLPTEAVNFLDVVGNTNADGTPGKQIRMVDRSSLDAGFPNWQTESEKDYITNLMYDPKNRKTYWVYPPAAAGTKIDLIYSYFPAIVTSTDAVPLDDIYITPLVDYVLYRAFSKESEQPGSAQRAAAHLQLFSVAITALVNMRGGSQPKE